MNKPLFNTLVRYPRIFYKTLCSQYQVFHDPKYTNDVRWHINPREALHKPLDIHTTQHNGQKWEISYNEIIWHKNECLNVILTSHYNNARSYQDETHKSRKTSKNLRHKKWSKGDTILGSWGLTMSSIFCAIQLWVEWGSL